jgi:REP-associated tyrosine transposase
MLEGLIAKEVQGCLMIFCQQLDCEIVAMNLQVDHVQLLVKAPPKLSISKLMGVLKGRTGIRLFTEFPSLRKKPYWGNHFLAKVTA